MIPVFAPTLFMPGLIAPAADAFKGAIVYNSADSGSTNFNNTVLTWDSELVDIDAIHSTSVTTGRLTIPSALNGRYGVLHCNVELTSVAGGSNGYCYIARNGLENFDGAAIYDAILNTGLAFAWLNVWTPAVLLTTGDYYEAVLACTDTATILQSENVQWTLEVVGS